MRKTILCLLGAAVLCTSPILTSCKEDEPSEKQEQSGGNQDNDNQDDDNSGEPSDFTPDEAKIYLEETAKMAANLLTPESHRVLRDFTEAFLQEYDGYYFEDDDESWMAAPMKTMAKALASGDYEGLTRAVEIYDINFERFAGVYEPDTRRECFVKVASAKDRIEIKCPVKGKDSKMIVKPAGNSWSFSYDDIDEYYDDTERYNCTIPETIDMTVTWGNETILSAKVNSNYDPSSKTAKLHSTLKSSNLEITRNIDITNTQIKYHIELIVNGTKLVAGDATVDGTNLCDVDMIRQFAEDCEDGKIRNPVYTLENKFLKTGKATVKLLNRVKMNCAVEQISLIADALQEDGDFYDSSDSAEAKMRIVNACEVINKNAESLVYFGSSTTPNARMQFEAKKWQDKNSDWGSWEIAPKIIFDDNTGYYMDAYFSESNFASTISLYENLVNRWISFFES